MSAVNLRWLAAALVLLALVVRVGAALEIRHDPINTDGQDFIRHGLSLAAGQGYPESFISAGHGPTALRPPAYPALLGGVFAVTGDSLLAARLVGAILGAAAVGLLGLISLRLFGAAAGLATLALAAVYPPLVAGSVIVLSEALFIPLAVAALAAAQHATRRSGDLRWVAVAGVLTGIASLTRLNGAFLLAPIALMLWAATPAGPSRRRRLVPVAVAAGVALLCVAPWTARNTLHFGAIVPVDLEDGIQIAGVMNDESRTDPSLPAAWRPPSLTERYGELFRRPDLDEYEINERLRSKGIEYLLDHPGYGVEVAVSNLKRYLGIIGPRLRELDAEAMQVRASWLELGLVAFWLVALTAVAGAVLRRVPVWVWAALAVMAVSALVNATSTRYRLPSDLFLLMLSGAAVAELARRVPLLRRLQLHSTLD